MNELVRLVEAERREQTAIAVGALVGLGFIGVLTAQFWVGGLALVVLGLIGGTRAFHRRNQLGRLLDDTCEIERVERITWLRRPALRVLVATGDVITLPTWNADRERIFELLQHRELPPARVVR